MGRKRVANADPGTATRFGGNDTDLLMGYLEGDDQSVTYPATINTTTTYGMGKTVAPNISLYDYYVFSDPNDSNKFKARNNTTGAIQFVETSFQTLLSDINTAFGTGNGSIFFKRGSFDLPGQAVFGSTNPSANILLKGEGMDTSTVRWTGANVNAQISIYFKCNYQVSDLSFNGNHLGFTAFGTDAYPVYGILERVHTYNQTGCAFVNNGGALGEIMRNCWIGPTDGLDSHASFITEYSIIEGNYFDRRTGNDLSGPTITYGGGQNIIVRGNIIKRAPTYSAHANDGTAISVEGWHSPGNYNITIENNEIEYGKIYVGGQFLTPPPTSTFSKINISNNNLLGGLIQVEAGTNATPSNEVVDVNIHHNNIQNAFWGGIMLSSVQGPTIIDKNIIHDTNTLGGTGEDRAGIYLLRCRNGSVLANTIQMTDTSTNGSPFGIGYDNCTNLRLYDNHIINTNTKTAINATTAAGVNTNILTRNNDVNT